MGYARRNFMVPIPRVSSWDELNARLEAQCNQRRERRLRGHGETIGERFEHDRVVLLPLPTAPYEACEKVTTRVSSLALVRYRGNDYSVPTRHGHLQVLVRGYVHEVTIACASEVIARHARSYEREAVIFDPLHYLALLEQKTRALDQAAPLAGWLLPECFATLRRLLEARLTSGRVLDDLESDTISRRCSIDKRGRSHIRRSGQCDLESTGEAGVKDWGCGQRDNFFGVQCTSRDSEIQHSCSGASAVGHNYRRPGSPSGHCSYGD